MPCVLDHEQFGLWNLALDCRSVLRRHKNITVPMHNEHRAFDPRQTIVSVELLEADDQSIDGFGRSRGRQLRALYHQLLKFRMSGNELGRIKRGHYHVEGLLRVGWQQLKSLGK